MRIPSCASVACLAMTFAWLGPASACGAAEVGIETETRSVKAYEKIEFTLRTDVVPANPYDPGEIDLRVDLTGPGGKRLTVPAFRYQPFQYARHARGGGTADWIYPTGDPVWKARFATGTPGRWTAVARLDSPCGSATSKPATFTCRSAPGRGYVRVSEKDPRFLEFSNGTPFFAVGQNVAFVKDTEQSSAMIRSLGRQGGNFARVWACCEDWAMAIEARKSGWARSWAWKPPTADKPGRAGYHRACGGLQRDMAKGDALAFSPTRPLAVRPDTRYVLKVMARTEPEAGLLVQVGAAPTSEPLRCGKRWTEVTHAFSTGAGRRFLVGWYNQVDSFILDRIVETAEDAGVYLQIVMLTRDHYMHLLGKEASPEYARAVAMAKRLVRYFVARWGYSTHVAVWEYFNEMNPGLPTERFYSEVGSYLETADPWRHLRATSDWHSPSKAYKHPALDTADMHYYMRPTTGDLFKDAVASVRARARVFRERAPRKPAIFSEFGMTTDNWQRPDGIDTDARFLHLHNALWTSALSGLASTVCHWYWDDIHKRNLYPLYKPVADFVADIPFTTAGLRSTDATVTRGLRVVGLQGERAAYLWLSDPASTWWKVAKEGHQPAEIRGAAVKVTVRWWDTRLGKVVREETARCSGGTLSVQAPALTGDIAVKVEAASR